MDERVSRGDIIFRSKKRCKLVGVEQVRETLD